MKAKSIYDQRKLRNKETVVQRPEPNSIIIDQSSLQDINRRSYIVEEGSVMVKKDSFLGQNHVQAEFKALKPLEITPNSIFLQDRSQLKKLKYSSNLDVVSKQSIEMVKKLTKSNPH